MRCKRAGGGFGGKAARFQEAYLASVAAHKFGRPVRLALNRNEDMETTGHRHELMVDYDVDFDEEGSLVRS